MTEAKDADQLRDEIERTRAELAETVDALSAKLDVKAQAKHRVEAFTAQAQPYKIPIAAGAAGLVALVIVLKLRGRDGE